MRGCVDAWAADMREHNTYLPLVCSGEPLALEQAWSDIVSDFLPIDAPRIRLEEQLAKHGVAS
jgi:hypothetical protein